MRLSARGVRGDMASDAPGKGIGGLWWRRERRVVRCGGNGGWLGGGEGGIAD